MSLKNIKKTVSTKNYYILVDNLNSAIIIKKDSFTKGTLNAFELFLKQKGLH